MKIVLFSDVHANLPALEAVLADIDRQNPDALYCLGDLVGYAPWPNEVIEAVRARHIPTIAGNYDYGVGQNSNDCGCAYKTDEDKKRGNRSIRFTNEVITDDNRSFLNSLPSHLRLEMGQAKQKQSLLMVHGSPRKINEYLYEDRPEDSFLRMMVSTNTHLLAFGHTHKPFHKVIQDSESYRHAINIGSVGKPKDGDARACYTMVEWDGVPDFGNPNAVEVTFHRVKYDVDRASEAILESKLPDAFAKMLREAF